MSDDGYTAARADAAVIRRTDRAFVRMYGRDPLRMIQGLVTNDVAGAPDGQSVYAALLTPKGRMVTDMRIFRRTDDILLDLPKAALESTLATFRKFVPPLFARFEDITDRLEMHGIYGPNATAHAARLFGDALPEDAPEGAFATMDAAATESEDADALAAAAKNPEDARAAGASTSNPEDARAPEDATAPEDARAPGASTSKPEDARAPGASTPKPEDAHEPAASATAPEDAREPTIIVRSSFLSPLPGIEVITSAPLRAPRASVSLRSPRPLSPPDLDTSLRSPRPPSPPDLDPSRPPSRPDLDSSLRSPRPLSPPDLAKLRIEAGTPLWGAELDEKTIPLEANLRASAISETKGCYTGQEVIIRILHRGHVNRHLRGLRLGDAPVPDAGTPLFRADDGKQVGSITSAAASPRFGETIALGYVRREIEPPGAVRLGAPDGPEIAVVALPFEEETAAHTS